MVTLPMTLGALTIPNYPIFTFFCNTFHISVTGDATDFKFGKFGSYADHSMPGLPMTNGPSWRGRGQGHLTNFRIVHPLKYLWNGWSYSRRILCGCGCQVLAFGQLIVPERGVTMVTWSLLKFCIPWNIFRTVKVTVFKFCARVGYENY